MRLRTPSFLHGRSRGVRPSASEIALRPSAPPPDATDGSRERRDQAFYLVVLEVIPPECPRS